LTAEPPSREANGIHRETSDRTDLPPQPAEFRRFLVMPAPACAIERRLTAPHRGYLPHGKSLGWDPAAAASDNEAELMLDFLAALLLIFIQDLTKE
jgi:hypothetical protein